MLSVFFSFSVLESGKIKNRFGLGKANRLSKDNSVSNVVLSGNLVVMWFECVGFLCATKQYRTSSLVLERAVLLKIKHKFLFIGTWTCGNP